MLAVVHVCTINLHLLDDLFKTSYGTEIMADLVTGKIKHLHTTISEETFEKIKTLSKRHGSHSKTIEKAIDLLELHEGLVIPENKQILDADMLWGFMRSELNMVAVGKTTFLSYINDIPERAIQNNNATEIIEWFYNYKRMTDLTLEEIIRAIKVIWISANYFRSIRCERIGPFQYKMVFSHDLNDIKYSQYWGKYFQTFFEKLGKETKILCRPQIFHVEVQERPMEG